MGTPWNSMDDEIIGNSNGDKVKGGTMDKKQMVQIIVIACVISCFLIGLACTIIGAAQDMDSVAICAIVFMLVAAASITIYLILDNVKKSAVSCSLQIFIIIFAVLSTVVFFGLAVAAVA